MCRGSFKTKTSCSYCLEEEGGVEGLVEGPAKGLVEIPHEGKNLIENASWLDNILQTKERGRSTEYSLS